MKALSEILIFILSGLLIAYCGEKKSGNNNASSNMTSNIPDKKMCELLTKETMSSITGITFNEEMSTLHQTDKAEGKYVSQCGYYSDGGNMGVLVRRFGNSIFPKEKEALIGGGKTGDAELDKMLDDALNTCKTVTGLGDAAYFYDLGGIYNLILVFDGHYQIHITSYGKGFGFDDKTLEVSKKVALEVIKIFS